MSSQQQQLRNLERAERYRTLRNWALGVSLVALLMAGTVAGFGGGNPESATSAYSSFALAGFMRWAVIPLLSTAFALLIIGALLHGLTKRGNGEV